MQQRRRGSWRSRDVYATAGFEFIIGGVRIEISKHGQARVLFGPDNGCYQCQRRNLPSARLDQIVLEAHINEQDFDARVRYWSRPAI
jgi:hypothetical protein